MAQVITTNINLEDNARVIKALDSKIAELKELREEKVADVTVNVDVSKIVRNVGIAGVCIVGIIFGCNTYRKVLQWKREEM